MSRNKIAVTLIAALSSFSLLATPAMATVQGSVEREKSGACSSWAC